MRILICKDIFFGAVGDPSPHQSYDKLLLSTLPKNGVEAYILQETYQCVTEDIREDIEGIKRGDRKLESWWWNANLKICQGTILDTIKDNKINFVISCSSKSPELRRIPRGCKILSAEAFLELSKKNQKLSSIFPPGVSAQLTELVLLGLFGIEAGLLLIILVSLSASLWLSILCALISSGLVFWKAQEAYSINDFYWALTLTVIATVIAIILFPKLRVWNLIPSEPTGLLSVGLVSVGIGFLFIAVLCLTSLIYKFINKFIKFIFS